MIRLTVDINVKNHEELIVKRKGPLAGKLASLTPNPRGLVENEVKKEVLIGLKRSLENELKNNGVDADVSVY